VLVDPPPLLSERVPQIGAVGRCEVHSRETRSGAG
jgi:hypothetical protein